MQTKIPLQKIFNGQFKFVHGAAVPNHILRQNKYPEIAFVGRSNVGKSTLINALTNQKNLCRTSNTPGRTQQVNYFLNNKNFYLVDLPGYGYAKVSKQMRKEWNQLMFAYFNGNEALKHVFILVDARRGILDSDHEMLDYIQDFPYSIVLTKAVKGQVAEIPGDAILTSATKKHGLEDLQKKVCELVL